MSSYTMTITQALRHSSMNASDSSHSATASDLSNSTTVSDSSHPIISVESADTAQCHLLSYLGSPDTLDDLRLRIPETVLFSRPVEKILKSALRQKRKFSYDRETSLLRIYAIARPVHDAISHFVGDFKIEAAITGFITPEERKYIHRSNAGVLLAKIRFDTNQKTKKRQAWTKFPDATIEFGAESSMKLQSVVFEVGFSENYTDLVSDAKQWLERSRGKTRLVILVNIEEDKKSRKARLNSNEAKTRIRDLVARFGNVEGKRREGIDEVSDVEPDVEFDGQPDADSDADSDADLYDEIEAAIMTEDWVGPISATLEVWHKIDGTPKRRQPPIVKPLYSYV